MAIISQHTSGGRAFDIPELAPFGTFFAVCQDIKDRMGVQRPSYENPTVMETVDLTAMLFELTGPDGRTYQVATNDMKISGHEKSALMVFLKAWLGKTPPYGWDYCEMIGKQALITVEHRTSRLGKVYAAITSISPLPTNMAMPTPPPAHSSTNNLP